MPRQGVPYPSREICSLKCQIDALQRQINELMKSVNGVEGDGQGNVSLISGDPAIVINNDQVQHEIEISLNSAQLPAAAVSSVNSQTGAVQLEADDIPSDGNSDVQADIDALKALGVNLQGAINNEVTARGNADAALQGNINTVQASIPGEAANAVANDPTVQGLVTADTQNVKLGGAQNITGVKTVPTEATGSATQQIANGAKVKNELDAYAPMVRTSGNQDIAAYKTFIQAEGLREITTAGFNNLIIGSGSVYNYLVSRKYTADRSAFDPVFDLGCFYTTAASTWLRLQLQSPKTVIGDTSQKQTKVRLCLRCNNDDTCSVYLEAEKQDGTAATKILGSFNGTTWS